MITGDSRCMAPTDLSQSDDTTSMMRATTLMETGGGFKLKIRQAFNGNRELGRKTIEHPDQLNRANANELLKLTNLKLNDDDADESDSETTTSTSRSLQAQSKSLPETTRTTTTTIEAQAKLDASGQRARGRMLLVANCGQPEEQHSRPPSAPTSAAGAASAIELNQKQQQLVELDSRYATIDYPMQPQQHYEQQPNATTASHFVSNPAGSSGYSTLELEANYPAYGSHSDYLIGQHQAQVPLEFLELEPSLDSRPLRLESNTTTKTTTLYQHHQPNLVNFESSRHQQRQYSDSTTTTRGSHATSYLSLEPSPAACNLLSCYDSDHLPDSVIQFNHQQQQQHHQQFTSTIQFANNGAQNQYYTNHSQQQHQDGCSSLSCADDNSRSLAEPNHHDHNGFPQHPGSSRLQPMMMMQHHHQQQMNQPYPLVVTGSTTTATSGQLEPELKVCEWEGCENTFLDMQEFVKHLEDRHVNQKPNEKNRYFCLWSNCKRNEQEFNARYKLLIHMRVHSGEKPYPCNNMNCKKSFSRLENLKIHQRSHTGEKPYKCIFDACSKSFTNSSDRIKHHKTHKDPKPYSCNYDGCSKRYTDPSSLRKHLRAHKRGSQQVGPAAASASAASSDGAAANSNCCDLQSSSGGSNSELGPQPLGCCSASYDPASLLLSASSSSSNTFATSTIIHHDHREQQTQIYSQPSNLIGLPNNRAASTQQYHQQPFPFDQQQQHNQLSRSWCAGTTTSNNLDHQDAADHHRRPIGSSHWTHQLTSGSGLGLGQPEQQQQHSQYKEQHDQQQQQQRRHIPAPVQQLRTQHESLMRSLPLAGGFRVPFSRLSHAHAEWPPPRPTQSQSVAGPGGVAAAAGQPTSQQFGQQQP